MERLEPGSPPRGIKSRPSAMKRRLVKIGAWILAVPALCAAVIVGGAAPLYLLLPSADTPPSAQAPAVAEPGETPTPAPATASNASDAPAPADEAAFADLQSTGAVAEAEEPPVAELPAVAAVPTPRPVDATGTPAKPDAEERRLASLSAPAAPRTIEGSAAAPRQAEQRRVVVRQTVNLRAGPGGRKIGTVGKGTEVAVGRCEGWCEISVGGVRGFVHASLINGTSTGTAEAEQRQPVRANRYTERRRVEAARESDWLREERRRVGRGGTAEPDWLDAQESAPLRRRPPPIEYYDPEFYDPYY